MSQAVKILTVILVVQIGLIAWVHRGGEALGAFSSEEKFIGLEFSALDKITIEEKDKEKLVLQREEGEDSWVLPGHDNFPVEEKKLNDIGETLFSITKSYPVGQTDVAAKQFRLTDDEFERKVSFFKGDKLLKTLYIGTSPGFKKVHARVGDENLIYSVEYSAYKASSKSSDWFEKDFLNLDITDVAGITTGSLVFKDSGEGLKLEGLSENESTVAKEVTSLASNVSAVVYEDVLGIVEKPEFKGDFSLKFSVDVKGKEIITYDVTGPMDKDFYVLKSSEHPHYFKVRKAKYDKIKNSKRETFVKVAEVPEQEAPVEGEAEEEAAPVADSKVSEKESKPTTK